MSKGSGRLVLLAHYESGACPLWFWFHSARATNSSGLSFFTLLTSKLRDRALIGTMIYRFAQLADASFEAIFQDDVAVDGGEVIDRRLLARDTDVLNRARTVGDDHVTQHYQP